MKDPKSLQRFIVSVGGRGGWPAVLSLPEKIDLTLVSSGGMEAVTGGMLPAAVGCVFVLVFCMIFADRRWRVT